MMMLDDKVINILIKYGKFIIIDLHSYSDGQVFRLFKFQYLSDIFIVVEERFYSKKLTEH